MHDFPFIPREMGSLLEAPKRSRRAEILFGPRQVGKTTLLAEIMRDKPHHFLSGENIHDLKVLSDQDAYLPLLRDYPNMVIDEAQLVPGIGRIIKQMVDDRNSNCQLYVTGSSSLDLAYGIMESAAGRINTYQLWPFSLRELASNSSWHEVKRNLSQRLIYGCYPTVINEPEHARSYLRDLVTSVLFKDIFALGDIRKPHEFTRLVTYLAATVGSEIRFGRISNDLGIASATIERWISLLESCFIIKAVPTLCNNAVTEIKKGKKIFFVDNGIRNVLLDKGFDPLATRNDIGALWENLFFSERLKRHATMNANAKIYFWKSRQNQEMDFVEIIDGQMQAFECKFRPNAKAKSVKAFKNAYPDCPVHIASPDNIDKL